MFLIYDLDSLLEKLQSTDECHIKLKKVHRKWRNNHELCIQNYEKMKESRKRIIKQRDNLKKQNVGLINQIEKLKEYSKLQQENNDLYRSLQSANAKIQELERKLNHSITEKGEYNRRCNLIQTILDGKF